MRPACRTGNPPPYRERLMLARAQKLINQGTTSTQGAKMIGVSRATLYRALQREAA
jgi:hypothetical protein